MITSLNDVLCDGHLSSPRSIGPSVSIELRPESLRAFLADGERVVLALSSVTGRGLSWALQREDAGRTGRKPGEGRWRRGGVGCCWGGLCGSLHSGFNTVKSFICSHCKNGVLNQVWRWKKRFFSLFCQENVSLTRLPFFFHPSVCLYADSFIILFIILSFSSEVADAF